MLNRFAAGLVLAAAMLAAPHASAAEEPTFSEGARNPPPAAALGTFDRFEVSKVAMGAPFTEYKTNIAAQTMLQANLDERVLPVVNEWNARTAGERPRTLRIEPEIRYVRFITGGKRFWGGALAGGSSMLLRVKLSDAATGEVIAEPDFYQHANAMGAAWSFGATDKHMLIRLSGMVADYLRDNYEKPTGSSISVARGHED